ncbi:MAG: DUF3991 domain-containing protein [Lachnospiraceae bacterium]
MGFTKRELIEFLDGLVELVSEENKVKAILVKEKFISAFTDMKRKRVFIFSAPVRNNCCLYSYLTGDKTPDSHTVEYFISCELIYDEPRYRNNVFKGNDVQGKTCFARMRGKL